MQTCGPPSGLPPLNTFRSEDHRWTCLPFAPDAAAHPSPFQHLGPLPSRYKARRRCQLTTTSILATGWSGTSLSLHSSSLTCTAQRVSPVFSYIRCNTSQPATATSTYFNAHHTTRPPPWIWTLLRHPPRPQEARPPTILASSPLRRKRSMVITSHRAEHATAGRDEQHAVVRTHYYQDFNDSTEDQNLWGSRGGLRGRFASDRYLAEFDPITDVQLDTDDHCSTI